jgi:hypothetical protein
MSIVDDIRELNLDPNSMVELFCEDTGDGVNYRYDVDYHGIMLQSDLPSMVAEMVATKGLRVYTTYGGTDTDILTDMRDRGYLEDYDRDFWFAGYIEEQFRDWDVMSEIGAFDHREDRFDYSRGHVYPQARVRVTVADFLEHSDSISHAWEVTVRTPRGRSITFS